MERLITGLKLLGGMLLVWMLLAAPLLAYVTQPLLFSVEAPALPLHADPARLRSHVEKISAEYFPRDYQHPENLDRVAAWLKEQFGAAGAETDEQAYVVDEAVHYRNVIARYGPKDGPLIVIGAHYDSAGELPAADDNASGVAGLLELARMFQAASPSVPVELVAYTLEEPPYFRSPQMGSAVHARSLHERGVKVSAMLALEMIGTFLDEEGSQSYPLPGMSLLYPSRGDYISIVGSLGEGGLARCVKAAMRAASPLPVYSVNAPSFVPGVDFSDHLSYWNEGYAALMVTDTAFYRNTRYHSPEDVADRLDYVRMAQVVDGIYAATFALAR